jgi:hypothetical protein
MPAGGEPLGFVYFVGVKYAGYTAYCAWAIQRAVRKVAVPGATPVAPWLAGGARTLIGVVVGAAVSLGYWAIPFFSTHDGWMRWLFFGLLIPVRVGEWWLLLRWIYGGFSLQDSTRWKLIAGGIGTSFGLDGLGIVAAFVLPGGLWVC